MRVNEGSSARRLTRRCGRYSPDFIISALDPADMTRLKMSMPVLGLGTGAELLRSPDIRDEVDLLPAADQARFIQLVETFIKDNGAVTSAPLQVEATGTRR